MTLEERNKLVEDNIALAKYCAVRFRGIVPFTEMDDVISLAYIGLVNAADRYDPKQGKFSSFAYVCIRQAFGTERVYRDRKRRIPHEIVDSIESRIPNTVAYTFADVLESKRFEEDSLNSVIAQEALSYVKGKRLDALVRHFLNGERVIDIAQSRGVSHQAVDSMIKCATAAIHRKMCKRYGEAVQNDI